MTLISRGTRAGCHSDKTMKASTIKCNLSSLNISGTVDPIYTRFIGLSNLKCYCDRSCKILAVQHN